MRVWLNIPGCCSVAQLCLTLCDRIECSMQGLPVLHYLPELAQTPVYWVSGAIWPSRSLPSPSLAFNLCQHTMSQLFTSCGQSIGAWASASVIPMNIQDWFPLGWIAWISLESKGLLRVFSNTTVQKHQFSSVQPSLWSDSHIHNMTIGKTIALIKWTFVGKVMSLLFNTWSRLVTAFLLWILKEQASFNFMAAATICGDFGAQVKKVCHWFHCFPIHLP